jgi:hypothetical protein
LPRRPLLCFDGVAERLQLLRIRHASSVCREQGLSARSQSAITRRDEMRSYRGMGLVSRTTTGGASTRSSRLSFASEGIDESWLLGSAWRVAQRGSVRVPTGLGRAGWAFQSGLSWAAFCCLCSHSPASASDLKGVPLVRTHLQGVAVKARWSMA